MHYIMLAKSGRFRGNEGHSSVTWPDDGKIYESEESDEIVVDARILRCFAFVWYSTRPYDTVEVKVPATNSCTTTLVRYMRLPIGLLKSVYDERLRHWWPFTPADEEELISLAFCDARNLRRGTSV